MALKDLLKIKIVTDAQVSEVATGLENVQQICSLIAAAGPLPETLGTPGNIAQTVIAAIYQDEDAHEDCSLTACLNPLHPGPCKGWKGTLFKTAPGAWHSLEAAKVEKANAARIKKIEALKAQGKPIPKKLLTPIVAKPHPHAGQTANKASGGAYEAGKAVSDAAGVKNNLPGKVTLGQATKAFGPVEKGPKGKKPTLASKGIAFVIAQEKVTPQYKLDKTAAITPEQWADLSEADKATIRGELAKIKIDGFGPQQKKADELLAKLADKPAELKPGTPDTVTTPKGKTYQKVSLKDLQKPSNSHLSPIHPPKVETIEPPKVKKDPIAEVLEKAKAAPPKVQQANEPGVTPPPLTAEQKAAQAKAAADKAAKAKVAADLAAKAKAAGPPKVTQATEVPAAPSKPETVAPADKPKPLPAHVQNAIDMAKGTAPGASWSKNHLAAYQPLTGDEFDALPKDVQAKIVAELHKATTKFLDPKKVVATKALLAKFGHGDGSTPAPAVPKVVGKDIGFSKDLHNHAVTQAEAKSVVEKTPIPALYLLAKQVAGVTTDENPDSGKHAIDASNEAANLVSLKTNIYNNDVLGQPAVKAAQNAFFQAATDQALAEKVAAAKQKAYNKVSLAVKKDGLSPIEKAGLVRYGKYLLAHNEPPSDLLTIDKLKADSKTAGDELTETLHAALKQANAPKPEAMSPAQIEDRTKELLGDLAIHPKTNLDLGELQYAEKMAKAKVADEAKAYPHEVLIQPMVASKMATYQSILTQINATNQELHHLDSHIKNMHLDAIKTGTGHDGKKLTADDKVVIQAHAGMLIKSHGHLATTLAYKQGQLPGARTEAFNAADKALADMKPVQAGTLDDFDKGVIDEVYRQAWGKAASKAVTYGIKTYGVKTQMSNHADYPALKQELGDLQTLAGKLALATAEAHTAKLAVPTDENDVLKAGPEKKAWLNAVLKRDKIKSDFDKLHKTAQGHLDTIRLDAGLKKRALPKLDNAAVKTAAAESAYYKTGGYGKPLYGKSASAKQYLVAKVGPTLAVGHKTSGDKAAEKAQKQAAEAAKVQAAMPPPKTHVKPPSSEAGKGPNPETAGNLGYHYTPKVAEGDQHGWPTAEKPAYVSSPEQLADLQKHLGNEDTKYGLAAQKEFKWSINNMEGKGAASSGKNALYSYTGSSYGTINEKLNSLPPGTQKTGSPQISSIDAAFAASPPLEGDVILYRGFASPESVFKSGKWNPVNVAGTEWTQRSYSSTSGQLSTAQSFAGYNGVVMRVIIPKEMKVKGINAKGGQHPGENEIILERGVRYRVIADYGKGPSDNRRYIDVMVVPSPYDKPE
jgi:hypothetical protein